MSENDLDELAAAEALANSLDVSDSEEDSGSSSNEAEVVQDRSKRKTSADEQNVLSVSTEDRQEVKSAAGNGQKLTDLFLSLDTSALRLVHAHSDMEEEEDEEEDDDEQPKQTDGRAVSAIENTLTATATRREASGIGVDFHEEEFLMVEEFMMEDVAGGQEDPLMPAEEFQTEEVRRLCRLA